MKSYQMFLSKIIEERRLVSSLESVFHEEISSPNCENINSKNYLQYLEYEEDFPLSINLICGEKSDINYSELDFAKILSRQFSVEVLFQPIEAGPNTNWCIVNSNGETRTVDITDSEAGIKIIRK